MFYTRYLSLCQMRGVSPSGGADEMNINRATVTFWKKDGFSPRQSTLEKLSGYFGVPLSYLTGEETEPCPLCGGSGPDHALHHRSWKTAVEQFGFCWNRTLREASLARAQQSLSAELPPEEQITFFHELAKAHFSQSLELCDYNPAHISLPHFRRLLLMKLSWEERLSPSVFTHLKEQPIPTPRHASPLCVLPKTLFHLATLPVSPAPAAAIRLNDSAAIEPVHFTGAIPLLGRIAAGSPLIAEEHIEEYIPTSLPHPEEYFALRIKGDSMIGAGIHDGDTVMIHRQDTARHGQIVACLVNNEEATLKRFTVSENTVLLLPENSKYQPIVVKPGDFETGKAKILGVATEVKHPLL